jgi:hypothetical protein
VSRPRPASRPDRLAPSLAYVRDTDTPVVLADVVDALELVTDVAEARRDPELARLARHVHALAASLRTQFVSDLTGPHAPAETDAVDRSKAPRGEAPERRDSGARMRVAR